MRGLVTDSCGHSLAATIVCVCACVWRLLLQVLDYQNTQATLFPLLATVFAFHYTGVMMKDMYDAFVAQSDAADFSSLPELHATAAALKAVCTWTTSEGIEAARLACGGHGYSKFSGLPQLYSNCTLRLWAPRITSERPPTHCGVAHYFFFVLRANPTTMQTWPLPPMRATTTCCASKRPAT